MPKQILLADDSITIQKVIALTFAGEDYKITAVDNGSDAVVKAREMRPDIILADVVMPQKNGYEVCETIKNDPQLNTIPVLLLAGTFEPFDEDLAKKSGADGYIIKPFESQAIIQKVKELISRPVTAVTAAPQPSPPKPTVISSPVTAPVAPKPPVAPGIARPQPAPAVTPVAVTPARPVAAPAPASEEDFWGTMMEETEEKEALKKVSPAVSAKSEVLSEEVWEMGGFEEAVPGAEVGEEELWDSFAFEEAEDQEVEGGFEEVPEFELEEVSPESAEEPLAIEDESIAPEEFTFGEEIPEVSAIHEAKIEPQPAFIQGYEQTFEPEVISRDVPVTPPSSKPLPSAPPVSMSEDQLRVALSQLSREVIEKIVWEVVPDLAEMLIKEEIKRLQGKK